VIVCAHRRRDSGPARKRRASRLRLSQPRQQPTRIEPAHDGGDGAGRRRGTVCPGNVGRTGQRRGVPS